MVECANRNMTRADLLSSLQDQNAERESFERQSSLLIDEVSESAESGHGRL
jgi:hypothetical protein